VAPIGLGKVTSRGNAREDGVTRAMRRRGWPNFGTLQGECVRPDENGARQIKELNSLFRERGNRSASRDHRTARPDTLNTWLGVGRRTVDHERRIYTLKERR